MRKDNIETADKRGKNWDKKVLECYEDELKKLKRKGMGGTKEAQLLKELIVTKRMLMTRIKLENEQITYR